MPAIRRFAFAVLLTATVAQPAVAETCNLTLHGSQILDDSGCTVSNSRGAVTINTDDGSTIAVRNSVLYGNFADVSSATSFRYRHPRLRAFGLVIKSDSNDEKTCYFSQKLVLCIDW